MSESEQNQTNLGVLGALGAAVAASACCTIPLLLVTFGAGGAWVASFTALEPFRPFFIAGALGLLAFAGYREYKTTMGPECDCEVSMQDRLRRGLLVVGLIATIGLIASPWIIRQTASADILTAASIDNPTMKQVVLGVEGMTCDACNITVQKALTNLDGVAEANVTFEPPQAVVIYNPALVTIEEMSEATTNVGYPSELLRQ